MRFFKRPLVAIILAVIIVIFSSFLSFNVKFGRLCDDVIYGFYDGVYYDGELHQSIADCIENVLNSSNVISDTAGVYDLDTEDFLDYKEFLELSIKYSEKDISYISSCYEDFMAETKELLKELRTADLSESDRKTVGEASAAIAEQTELIRTSGYNETVKSFQRKYDNGIVEHFIYSSFSNVVLPEKFTYTA